MCRNLWLSKFLQSYYAWNLRLCNLVVGYIRVQDQINFEILHNIGQRKIWTNKFHTRIKILNQKSHWHNATVLPNIVGLHSTQFEELNFKLGPKWSSMKGCFVTLVSWIKLKSYSILYEICNYWMKSSVHELELHDVYVRSSIIDGGL